MYICVECNVLKSPYIQWTYIRYVLISEDVNFNILNSIKQIKLSFINILKYYVNNTYIT